MEELWWRWGSYEGGVRPGGRRWGKYWGGGSLGWRMGEGQATVVGVQIIANGRALRGGNCC